MENHSPANSFTAVICGSAMAVFNNLTGFFNHPLVILNIQEDVIKALCVGFVGAIGGLAGKAFFSWTAKQFKKI